ncbi:hypothetical protein CC80DRAFT_243330 [Byssothecium circinans]|uniref:Uncharacterized protein n=1 Tax=Byssothecium circinans TaxID=147558 RepID=A0A6A5THL7_9PLEO|nr:hypothetical protein CC80DRAFT_243330 [Byssothecium circinans]
MVPFRRPSLKNRRSSHDPHADEEDAANTWHDPRENYIMTFPIHPLPSMQGPFEESMLEATGETARSPIQIPTKSLETRQQLLCREPSATELDWNFTYNCHWRYSARGKYHPLLKTSSQIIFGLHLLHQHLEKSVADVADILLKHVNELDSFLQRANEDLEGSLKDMVFRRKCLRVPMEHVNEFDRLLDDRAYRAQLLEGNVVIERTINRMSQLLNDYLADMSGFRKANQELEHYLMSIGNEWTAMNDDVGRIYTAMCGNTGGWAHFLQSLATKAEKLGVVLVQVSSYCNEIEKRCGAASRRSLITSRSSSRNSNNSREAARPFRNFANNKPLPTVPNERPPFITSPASSDFSSERGVHHRQTSSRLAHNSHNHVRVVSDAESDASPRQHGMGQPPHGSHTTPGSPQYHQAPSYSQGYIAGTAARDDSAVTLKQDVYKPELPVTFNDEKEVVVPKRVEIRKEEYSPPLTGKDSAYSSVSGGSVVSPTMAPPRSASAQSSYPRAQFGLFPSSTPSTPKQSISGRYGAASPAFSTSITDPNDTLWVPPPRAQTSLDSYTTTPRRLLRKSSLSSLKKLFMKKKASGVETIVE